MFTVRWTATFALAASLLSPNGLLAQVTVFPLALENQAAPNGDLFQSPAGGHVSADGSITFTNSSPRSIWKWSDQTGLQLLARESTTAVAGVPGAWFTTPRQNVMDASGNTVFGSQLGGVSSDQDRGFWFGTPGSLSLVTREGASAPGTGTGVFDQLTFGEMIGGDGTVTFMALLRNVPGSTVWSLWRWNAGTVSKVARGGDTGPGTGAPFGGFTAPAADSLGNVFFCTSGGNNNAIGYWKHDGSALTAIATRGPAPGFPAGTILDWPREEFCINNAGEIAFTFELANAPGGALWALYRASLGNSPEVIAAHHQQAADRPSGDWYHLLRPLALSDSGSLLFFANVYEVVNGTVPCLYVRDGTSTRLIHVNGTPAGPDGPALTYDYYNYPPIASINGSGLAVIGVSCPVGAETRGAVIGYTPYSGVFPIAQPGTLLEVAPGDVRTVTNAYIDRPDASRSTAYVLNDSGRCVFHAYFTDGSGGLFVADFQECRLAGRCPADFVYDGFVSGDDFDAFIDAFYFGRTTADFNADGFTTGDDFDGFTAAFIAGC